MYRQQQLEKLVLASASPRRAQLLKSVGLRFDILPSQVNEDAKLSEDPRELVERLAFEKAQEVARKLQQAWVLGADTVVVLDGQILGKPLDRADAARMLSLIQGRQHQVFGGIALLNSQHNVKEVQSHVSEVEIVKLDPRQIEAYIESGEPLDKAGSYAIQGIGAALVAQVAGSYTNVVGLNLSATMNLLSKYNLVS